MANHAKSIRILAASWAIIAFLIFLVRVFGWIPHAWFVTLFVGGFILFALLSTLLLHRFSSAPKNSPPEHREKS